MAKTLNNVDFNDENSIRAFFDNVKKALNTYYAILHKIKS